jgi:hypothetical protein
MEAIAFELAAVTLYPGLVSNISCPLHAINLAGRVRRAGRYSLARAPRFRLSLRAT